LNTLDSCFVNLSLALDPSGHRSGVSQSLDPPLLAAGPSSPLAAHNTPFGEVVFAFSRVQRNWTNVAPELDFGFEKLAF
jgi:hypothetical protein